MSSKVAKIDVGALGRVAKLGEDEQRVINGIEVPAVIECKDTTAKTEDVCQWVKENQDEIEKLLRRHGAVLFRGFAIKTAEQFDAFVQGFQGYEDLPYEESLSFAVRKPVTGRVCTTNEGKKGGLVFHHEQAQTPFWPSKIFFFCETPAETGGATGVCPSYEVARILEERHPEFVKKLEAVGVKYTSYMASVDDPTKGAGRSWKSFFGQDTKEAVEKRMTELGYTWEWLENETLKAVSPKLSAVRIAPGTNTKVFFNQLIAQIANAAEFSASSGGGSIEETLDKYLTFADGSSIDPKLLQEAKTICEEVAVDVQWQAGDIGLLDNYLVMHARRLFEGPRRVLASLVRNTDA